MVISILISHCGSIGDSIDNGSDNSIFRIDFRKQDGRYFLSFYIPPHPPYVSHSDSIPVILMSHQFVRLSHHPESHRAHEALLHAFS